MHKCLRIPEILSMIIACVYAEEAPVDLDNVDEMTLDPWHPSSTAALARTCRTFLEPALDKLWSLQYNLVNLVKCMPDDAWKQKTIGRGFRSGRIEVVRPM